jgi:hypothetical protein
MLFMSEPAKSYDGCPNGEAISAYATEIMVQNLGEHLLIRILSISKSNLFTLPHVPSTQAADR